MVYPTREYDTNIPHISYREERRVRSLVNPDKEKEARPAPLTKVVGEEVSLHNDVAEEVSRPGRTDGATKYTDFIYCV